jgi:hypothetical protein
MTPAERNAREADDKALLRDLVYRGVSLVEAFSADIAGRGGFPTTASALQNLAYAMRKVVDAAKRDGAI